MSYKNSVKLLTTNFNLVWKELLYMIIVTLLLGAVGYGFAIPTINLLKENNVINELSSIFETIYTAPKEVVISISNTMLHLTNVISNNFSQIWLSLLSTTLIIQFLFQLLKNISFYNLSSLMHLKMSSFVEVGYTRNLISTLRQSTRFSVARIIYKLPFTLLKLLVIFTYFRITSTPLGIFIGLFVVSLILITLTSIELTIFSGMAGYMLDKNGNTSAFKALFAGSISIFKTFPRVFSNAIITILTIIALNLFLGIFTLGVALIITLPASILFLATFELCAYFGSKEKRYYITSTTIVTPLKDDGGENSKKFN